MKSVNRTAIHVGGGYGAGINAVTGTGRSFSKEPMITITEIALEKH